jgi:hypothetical protein
MMTGFRLPEFGFRIGVAMSPFAATGAAATEATRTPTPRPKLSGGFGRPRSTPVPPTVAEGGQSLADVVRAAQETRGGGPNEKSGVTIDNRSLVTNPEEGRVSTSSVAAGKSPVPPPAAAAAKPAGEEAAEPSAAAPADGEAQWRATAHRARKRVEDAKTRVGELAASAKKLENDFYAWDDGQYRDRVIKPAWDRARSELEDARHELSDAEKDLAELPERARKAGALPGWIRE